MLTIEFAQKINAEVARSRKTYPKNANMNAALITEVGEFVREQLLLGTTEAIEAEGLQVIAVVLRILSEGDSSMPPRVEPVRESK